MASRAQYVVVETGISMVINAVLSVGFVLLVFHGVAVVPVGGAHGIVLDMAPQTFMVVLMSCLVPSLLTRRRAAAGALAWHTPAGTSPLRWVVRRALVVALAATAAVVAVSWIVLPRLLPAGVAFHTLVVAKAIFGMLLAALVTPWAIGKILR